MLIVKLADLNHATIDFSLLSGEVIKEADKFDYSSSMIFSTSGYAINQRRKKQFLLCRSLLAGLLNQYYQIPVLPQIVIGQNSRPRFADTNLPDFNISHSQDVVAVAISSQGKVGVDIELHRERKNYLTVANTFFSEEENHWLQKQPDPLVAFWQLWTLKESALKLYAKGVWQMKSVIFKPETGTILAPFAQDFYYRYVQLGDLHLSVNSDCAIDTFTWLN